MLKRDVDVQARDHGPQLQRLRGRDETVCVVAEVSFDEGQAIPCYGRAGIELCPIAEVAFGLVKILRVVGEIESDDRKANRLAGGFAQIVGLEKGVLLSVGVARIFVEGGEVVIGFGEIGVVGGRPLHQTDRIEIFAFVR